MYPLMNLLAFSLQSHFHPLCVVMDTTLGAILPDVLISLIIEYAEGGTKKLNERLNKYHPEKDGRLFDEYKNVVKKYTEAQTYLFNEDYLKPSNILYCFILLEAYCIQFSWKRKYEVYVGGNRIDPHPNPRKLLRLWLKDYKKYGNIAKLCYNIIHRLHPFYDGNGRICRILIAWHYKNIVKEPLVLIYNLETATLWQNAVASDNSDLLKKFITTSVSTPIEEKYGMTRECPWFCEMWTEFCTTTTVPSCCCVGMYRYPTSSYNCGKCGGEVMWSC